MSLIGWLVVGMLAGLVANRLADGERASLALDGVLGLAGAIGGGLMFLSFGGSSIRGFNIYSMVVAVAGAAAALLTYHALFVYPGDRGR